MKQTDFLVRSSIGSGLSGIVVSHFVIPGETKTICGRDTSTMTSRYKHTDESGACKMCWKKMLILRGKNESHR